MEGAASEEEDGLEAPNWSFTLSMSAVGRAERRLEAVGVGVVPVGESVDGPDPRRPSRDDGRSEATDLIELYGELGSCIRHELRDEVDQKNRY
jgi:hypothetical protein